MVCTIYSHEVGFEKITGILQQVYPNSIVKQSRHEESHIAEMEIKSDDSDTISKLKISYRERAKPSFQLPSTADCPLTRNLKGLLGYVASLPTSNEKVRHLFLQKIQTLNCEFAISQVQGSVPKLSMLIQRLAKELEAIVFASPNTVISRSTMQHFLDQDLNLIIDGEGNCEIEALEVNINSSYFDAKPQTLKPDQQDRKARSEKVLEHHEVKINRNLPCVQSETEIQLRSLKDIARRVTILSMTNHVAFNNVSGEEAIEYLQHYKLWEYVTPSEEDFLFDPTEEKKNHESWKCECIWTLMWALRKVNELGFPNELCSLDNIPIEEYPTGPGVDPNEFIDSISDCRTAAEILDANDLYYRMDWACVDARMSNQQITSVHPGVVYERHYALNWLINYRGQEWDDVTCDT